MSYVVMVFKKVFGFDEQNRAQENARGARTGPVDRMEADYGRRPRPTSLRCNNGISPPYSNPMKRIEVKLALPVVAPLLDVIRELADGLSKNLAAPLP